MLRRLYERGYDRRDRISLYEFLDGVLKLPQRPEADFQDQVERFEQETAMPIVTSMERRGIEKGRREGLAQGREQGLQRGALRQLLFVLRQRFDSVPAEVEAALGALGPERLEELMGAALRAASLAGFVAELGRATSRQ